MKGSKMSAILAILLMQSGVLAIVPTAHSQQIPPIGACLANASPFATRSITNSLNDLDHYYNFTFRLPQNAVLGTYTACTSVNYLGTPASQNTSFSVVQLGDLNSDGAVDFKDIVIFASDYTAYYSSTHVYTHAIGFNDGNKINFKGIPLFVHYSITYWSA